MRELFQEIWVSVRRNKLRTFMTGFSVAWGIFMLIILLGSGNGLKNGVTDQFGDRAVNSMSVFGGRTSMPFAGMKEGRRVILQFDDLEYVKNNAYKVVDITARSSTGATGSVGREFTSLSIDGVTPEFAKIEGIDLIEGRFLNERDLEEYRKVVVIDNNTRQILFKGKDFLGKEINIAGGVYTVIGLVKERSWGNNARVYAPITTVQRVFKKSTPEISSAVFVVDDVSSKKESEELEEELRTALGHKHQFNAEDKNAVWIRNRMAEYLQTMTILNGISIFVWVIGIGTLMAGIVGVSNIMLVTVRERTFEFGIRKALGAKPASIIALILTESTVITMVFGYVGMVLGIGLMEGINILLEKTAAASPDQPAIFTNPTVDLGTAITATLILVGAGLIAGYVPARRAAKLKTIDALRHNK